MAALPSFDRLMAALERLPGIGPKSARRMGHALLVMGDVEAEALVSSITEARSRTGTCSTCRSLTEEDPCRV